jgi:DNA-binding Xre family transcriptional regulator
VHAENLTYLFTFSLFFILIIYKFKSIIKSMSEVKQTLRKLIAERGMNLKSIAALRGCSEANISRFFSNTTKCDLITVQEIASLLKFRIVVTFEEIERRNMPSNRRRGARPSSRRARAAPVREFSKSMTKRAALGGLGGRGAAAAAGRQ